MACYCHVLPLRLLVAVMSPKFIVQEAIPIHMWRMGCRRIKCISVGCGGHGSIGIFVISARSLFSVGQVVGDERYDCHQHKYHIPASYDTPSICFVPWLWFLQRWTGRVSHASRTVPPFLTHIDAWRAGRVLGSARSALLPSQRGGSFCRQE